MWAAGVMRAEGRGSRARRRLVQLFGGTVHHCAGMPFRLLLQPRPHAGLCVCVAWRCCHATKERALAFHGEQGQAAMVLNPGRDGCSETPERTQKSQQRTA